jgi:predicted PurR-regulated permease PerM
LDQLRDESEGWFTRERILVLVLAAVTIGAFYLSYRLVLPFVPALTWALAIAVVAHPLHEWLQRRLRNRSLVAGIAVIIVAITVLAPAVFIFHQVISDAAATIQNVRAMLSEGRWRDLIDRNETMATIAQWIEREISLTDQLEQASKEILAGARKMISGSFYLVAGLLITLFLLFYFFRDKDKLLAALRRSFPLSPRETDRVFRKVNDTIYALVYGTVLVAFVQGALGGFMFWLLGLPSPLFWGTVMALLAILPLLGPAVVWIPATIYLAIEGDWGKAIVLTAWGSIVVGLIDNLIYPVVVKSRLRIHTVPVFIAVFGGLLVFGAAGLVLGPVVLAITVALADIWRQRMAYGEAVENGVDAERAGAAALPPSPQPETRGS